MLAVRKVRRFSRSAAVAWSAALVVCAACVVGMWPASAQQPTNVPFLTVPSGAPPAEPGSTISVEDAISAALKAAGATGAAGAGGGEPIAPPTGTGPRPN